MAIAGERYRFTVAEYERMGQTGILTEDARVELIEGAIVQMSPIGSRHAASVDRASHAFRQLLASAIIRVQSPIKLGEYSEPQPDVTLLRTRADFYADAHPGPEDVLLVVEVADTSLDYDRQTKLPLYARAGIPEAWLVDLPGNRLWVYRGPAAEGYAEVRWLERGQAVSPQAFPDVEIPVESVLG